MPKLLTRDVDFTSRFRCSCGFEGNFNQANGHLGANKGNPDCEGGITPIPGTGRRRPTAKKNVSVSEAATPPAAPPAVGSEGEKPESAPETPPPALTTQPPTVYDFTESPPVEEPPAEALPSENGTDPLAKLQEMADAALAAWVSGDGGGHDGNGHLPPDGSDGGMLVEEPQPGTPQVSIETVTVQLPVEFWLYYDGVRSIGWLEGRGTFSDFVATFLLSHLRDCLGLGIGMYNLDRVVREEAV